MGIGDWGLGVWVLGVGGGGATPKHQNPQTKNTKKNIFFLIFYIFLGVWGWGLGFGVWGVGVWVWGQNPQSPIPNPQ